MRYVWNILSCWIERMLSETGKVNQKHSGATLKSLLLAKEGKNSIFKKG